MRVSRTPVREALYKLAQEGYIQVASCSGWNVQPFDFELFESLYDLRVILELAAIKKICDTDPMPDLSELKSIWLQPKKTNDQDMQTVATLDEGFHEALITAAGNPEMTRIHREVTERIRIIRRLDFTQPQRIQTTYEEHARILRSLLARKRHQCELLLRAHIESSKAEVRKITLHKLHTARAILTSVNVAQKHAVRTKRSLAPATH
jgi:DNA-binding GntR family transcriptional regulator